MSVDRKPASAGVRFTAAAIASGPADQKPKNSRRSASS
jgi:hypothetical protein